MRMSGQPAPEGRWSFMHWWWPRVGSWQSVGNKGVCVCVCVCVCVYLREEKRITVQGCNIYSGCLFKSFSNVSKFFFNFILFFNFTILYWFCHISKWICHRYTCVPHPEPSSLLPPHTIPLGRPIAPAPNIQYRALNLDWRLVSYMILYIFQCHSPKSSHALPFPQSPKDCSIHLCLFCCLVYRVIVTIFLNSIYMRWYTVLVFFFLVYFSLYNRLQFHPPH